VRQHASSAREVAALMESLAHFGPAESLFRRAAGQPDEPEALLDLAEFLARFGRPREVLELCEWA
jgi:hypothetical protein